MNDLHVISWNVTRRCNLACSHCYLPAVTGLERSNTSSLEELTTRQAFQLIDQIGHVNPEVMLILSGGEPLLREDIFELSAYASQKGMMVVLGSNGVLIDGHAAHLIKQSGISGISISLDSDRPELHDEMRSSPGAWKRAVAAIQHCVNEGISVQVNTVVTSKNWEEIPKIAAYARDLGAKVYSPFFLVCTGRGEELTDISPQQYERVLSSIVASENKDGGMMIRTRCAPTIRRILYERDPDSVLLRMGTGRCLAGLSYCRISPEGDVTPCPYLPLAAGSIREGDFKDIWENADLFTSLRKQSLKGKCGSCTFRLLCGGCRARAFAAHSDYLEEDPWCDHVPHEGAVIEPPAFLKDSPLLPSEEAAPVWTKEAEDRLKRVPSFVRAMVRRAVERYASERHCRKITPDIMEELKQKTGMGGMHGSR